MLLLTMISLMSLIAASLVSLVYFHFLYLPTFLGLGKPIVATANKIPLDHEGVPIFLDVDVMSATGKQLIGVLNDYLGALWSKPTSFFTVL